MHHLISVWFFIVMSIMPAFVAAEVKLSVELHGLESHHEANALLFLSIYQQREHKLLSETRIRGLHKRAPDEIKRSLEAYGLYRPEVTGKLEEITENVWRAVYQIEPGSEIPIGYVEIKVSEPMQSDPVFHKSINTEKLQTGKAFKHSDYDRLKAQLSQLASERGYFDASYTKHLIEIDLKKYEARLYLHFDSGKRYQFGELNIQQTALTPELLDRYINFSQGTDYSQYKLIELQQALNDSDYFYSVEVSPDTTRLSNGQVPVNIKLQPRKQHQYSIGLGYGSDTGARARFDWQMPRVNREGHRFGTEVEVSQLGYNLGTQYRIPVLNPRTDQLVYNAAVINEETDTNESTLQTLGISLNHRRNKWREVISLNYQREDFSVADDQGESTLLLPGISWSRIWGSNFIYAIDGVRFDLEIRGANDQLVSDTSFLQLRGSVKAISTIWPGTRLIARGTFGSTETNNFDELPSSVRFFAGGAQSVRGYAYESLGPVDNNGDVIGGKHLLVGSLELEHWFTEKWGLALFYDNGNAIDDLNDPLEDGAGIGYRWKSPVGPIRIDVANALSDEDRPWRVHINIGPDL